MLNCWRTTALPLFFACLFLLPSCRSSVQKRPWGYIKLGKTSDFNRDETYLPDDRLIVRRDDKGLFVMSTASTYDLTGLRRQDSNGSEVWVSEEDTSRFDRFGKVISGPAVADLPFYEMKVDVSEVGGPADTVYAIIGSEKSSDWRLKAPTP